MAYLQIKIINAKNLKNMLPIYNTFAEKEQNFQIVKIDTLEKFLEVKEELTKSGGIFRGISNAQYKIYTSLQRGRILGDLYNGFSMDAYIRNLREMEPVKLYFRAYGYNPSRLALLSFLQHHRAPTPLLDFTGNVNVALFFSTESMLGKPFTPGENEISDYFSIFHIPEESLKLIDVKRVFEDIQRYKQEFIDTWGNQEENEQLYLEHIDSMAGMNTMEVFLIDFANTYPAFNVQNNIRILNQEGLFIHNSFGNEPLELALKKFFIPATQFVGSQLDEIDHPDINKINEKYQKDLENNREIQSKLAMNVIVSYEIHKSLVPEIYSLGMIDRSVIYPDFEKICSQAFEMTNVEE